MIERQGFFKIPPRPHEIGLGFGHPAQPAIRLGAAGQVIGRLCDGQSLLEVRPGGRIIPLPVIQPAHIVQDRGFADLVTGLFPACKPLLITFFRLVILVLAAIIIAQVRENHPLPIAVANLAVDRQSLLQVGAVSRRVAQFGADQPQGIKLGSLIGTVADLAVDLQSLLNTGFAAQQILLKVKHVADIPQNTAFQRTVAGGARHSQPLLQPLAGGLEALLQAQRPPPHKIASRLAVKILGRLPQANRGLRLFLRRRKVAGAAMIIGPTLGHLAAPGIIIGGFGQRG